jgi:hypothetical protein
VKSSLKTKYLVRKNLSFTKIGRKLAFAKSNSTWPDEHISVGAFKSTKVTSRQYIQSIDPPWLQRIMLQVTTMKIED